MHFVGRIQVGDASFFDELPPHCGETGEAHSRLPFLLRSCHCGVMDAANDHSRPLISHVSEVPRQYVARDHRLLLCRIDCGFPSPAADDLEEPIDLGAWLVEHPAASYVMRVQGTSMAAAGVLDGDHVVVDRSVTARPGHMVVALVHGDRTLKRLRRRDGRLWLSPEPAVGHAFPETIVDEDVEIWGVVVGVARRCG